MMLTVQRRARSSKLRLVSSTHSGDLKLELLHHMGSLYLFPDQVLSVVSLQRAIYHIQLKSCVLYGQGIYDVD